MFSEVLLICDNKRNYYAKEFCQAIELPYETFKKRFIAYGATSPMIFYKGRIPGLVSKIHLLPKAEKPVPTTTKYNEGKAKRKVEDLQPNGTYDDILFPMRRAKRGKARTKATKKKREKLNTTISIATLKVFNNKMIRRGLIRPVDFNNNALFNAECLRAKHD